MANWLGVVSRDHVRRGVSLGIAQVGHGKRAGLMRLRPGDWFVYYSPRESLSGNVPVKAFTAIGRIGDGDAWQADEGDFKPWRRKVDYLADAADVPVAELIAELDLTAGPNWGVQLRRGLIPLTDRDIATIRDAMTGARAGSGG